MHFQISINRCTFSQNPDSFPTWSGSFYHHQRKFLISQTLWLLKKPLTLYIFSFFFQSWLTNGGFKECSFLDSSDVTTSRFPCGWCECRLFREAVPKDTDFILPRLEIELTASENLRDMLQNESRLKFFSLLWQDPYFFVYVGRGSSRIGPLVSISHFKVTASSRTEGGLSGSSWKHKKAWDQEQTWSTKPQLLCFPDCLKMKGARLRVWFEAERTQLESAESKRILLRELLYSREIFWVIPFDILLPFLFFSQTNITFIFSENYKTDKFSIPREMSAGQKTPCADEFLIATVRKSGKVYVQTHVNLLALSHCRSANWRARRQFPQFSWAKVSPKWSCSYFWVLFLKDY